MTRQRKAPNNFWGEAGKELGNFWVLKDPVITYVKILTPTVEIDLTQKKVQIMCGQWTYMFTGEVLLFVY